MLKILKNKITIIIISVVFGLVLIFISIYLTTVNSLRVITTNQINFNYSDVYKKGESRFNFLELDLSKNIKAKKDNIYILNAIELNKTSNYSQIFLTDFSENQSSIKRNTIVYEESEVGEVYLTFDDGPSSSGTTDKILDILKEENVKATFFVTGKGPDYLIKRAYNEGHTVVLHTNTHEYGYLYSSVENYFNDLNDIENRVYNITGIKSKIIRFPGGSSNTVSNRYNNSIMNTLVQDVQNRGYYYFDWNVSGEDAGTCQDSFCVYSNVINGISKDKINMVLLHDTKYITANAIRDIIHYCKNSGYSFKTIKEDTTPIRFI